MKLPGKEVFSKPAALSTSQMFLSLNVMRPRPPMGLTKHQTKVILKVSIWTALALILLFLGVYTVLLAYVDNRFHRILTESPSGYRKRLHVKWRPELSTDVAADDYNEDITWNSTKLYSDVSLPQCQWQTVFRILVTSSVHHASRRTAIRKTWCSPEKFGFPAHSWHCIFLVGQSDNKTLMADLKKELNSHRDILVGNYLDTYRNLTLKVIHGFNWSTIHCPSGYVVKTDDDCFVNAGMLYNFLLYHNDKTIHLYVGNVVKDHNKLKVVRTKEKWAVSIQDYPNDYYPPYASGIGYILSSDVAKRLISASMYIKPFANEDAYVGVVLSQVGVQPSSSGRFSISSNGLSVCNLLYLLLIHDVSIDRQIELTDKAVAAPERCKNKKPIVSWA